MGMFDYFHYNGEEFQTKDLDNALYNYELREDGTLWREHFTIVLHSEPGTTLGSWAEYKDHHWVFEKSFDGSVQFYREDKGNGGYKANKWIEYKALFMDGKLLKLEKLS
jgi:hypothetical protein